MLFPVQWNLDISKGQGTLVSLYQGRFPYMLLLLGKKGQGTLVSLYQGRFPYMLLLLGKKIVRRSFEVPL